MHPWADDTTDERLIELRKQRLSFGQIAVRLSEEIGRTISRDAVFARARHLYLENRLARPEKKVDGKPVVTAPVQSQLSSLPPVILVELGGYRMSIAFEHVIAGRTKTAA